jgi:hypothetical protein
MTTYKPFNLAAALEGEPLITRDGRKVTEFIELKTMQSECKYLYVLEGQEIETVDRDGLYSFVGGQCEQDLFLAPTMKTYYTDIIKLVDGSITATDPYINKNHKSTHSGYIKTISFEIAE